MTWIAWILSSLTVSTSTPDQLPAEEPDQRGLPAGRLGHQGAARPPVQPGACHPDRAPR